jgi:hypothetical protein
LQRNPPGSGLAEAHVARGKELALAKIGDLGEDRYRQILISLPASAGYAARRFGGFAIYGSGFG